MKKYMLLCGFLACLATFKASGQSSAHTLRKAAEFDLPSPPGKRFDYLTTDPEDHYVYAPEQEENGRPVARIVVYEAMQ